MGLQWVDHWTYGSVGGYDDEDMEGNIWEEIGRNNMRSERGNKELTRTGQCPEKDSVA
jgi:hypothetical protein